MIVNKTTIFKVQKKRNSDDQLKKNQRFFLNKILEQVW